MLLSGSRQRVRLGEVFAVLGGAVLLTGSWVIVAVNESLPQWEENLFELVNGLPDFLWPIVWLPMQLGSVGGSLLVVAGTALVSRNLRLTLAALISEQVTFWGAKLVKRVVERGRPTALLDDVDLREDLEGLGYISGHAAIAFALAAALAPSLPRRWQLVAVAAACIVAAGRIYSGAHLPLDVMGGAGLGLLCGTLARWAFGLGGEGMPPRPGVDPA